MLARILGAHSMIHAGPEPHLLTPLAHLGVWARVDKARYDHIVAAIGQQAFVESLPHRHQDYWRACRAYCDVLYGQQLAGSGKSLCLDKTPEYATVLPFITRVFPDARYIVLTRHPLAIMSSFAKSFFDDDFRLAHAHDPVLERYVPAIAAFLRQSEVPFHHLRYEDLVRQPSACMQRICAYLGVVPEEDTIDYGRFSEGDRTPDGLGDPLGVGAHERPSTGSLERWINDVAADPQAIDLMRSVVARLDPADLATFGYPLETLWKPLENLANGAGKKSAKRGLTRYRMQRKLIVRGRAIVQRSATLSALLAKVRLACDVFLRERS